MNMVSYVMNDKGEKTGLLIDIASLKHEVNSEKDILHFMEDLEDVLAVELAKKEGEYSDWEDAKEQLRSKGIID